MVNVRERADRPLRLTQSYDPLRLLYCQAMLFLRRAFHLSPLGLAVAGAIAPVFLALISLAGGGSEIC